MSAYSLRARRSALVIWTLLVAVLLLVPTGDELPSGGVWDWLDKPAHLLIFALHCALLALSLRASMPGRRAAALALAGSTLYAVSLEVLQIPVPGRYFEWWDVAADLAGTTLGALLVAASRARLRGTS